MKNDIVVGVPCSKFKGINDYDKSKIATKEDEAVGIAVGSYLCGKNPLVFIQNSGLGNCIDIITSLLIPYKIKIKFLISNRTKPYHHSYMGKITRNILSLLNTIEYEIIDQE